MISCILYRGFVARGAERSHGPSSIFEIVGFSEILMFHRKIFGLWLLVKIIAKDKGFNFYRKIFAFAPLLYRCHSTSNIIYDT